PRSPMDQTASISTGSRRCSKGSRRFTTWSATRCEVWVDPPSARKPEAIQEGLDAEKDPRRSFLRPRRRHWCLRAGGRGEPLQRERQTRSRRERDRRPRYGEHLEPGGLVKIKALLSNLKACEGHVGSGERVRGSVRRG